MELTHLRGKLYDTRIKYINGKPVELMQCKFSVFNPDGLEVPSKKGARAKAVEDVEKDTIPSDDRAIRRAKRRVYDLCACNSDLQYFITLTLNAEKIDRYDYDIVIKKLNTWLDNAVRRKGLKYVLVCENHKDGAIHFHGLINNALKMKDSGKTCVSCGENKTIYNIEDWKLGFTTAIPISGEHENVCKYITKYITKQSNTRKGGRWYYHGGALEEPDYIYLNSYYEKLSCKGIESMFEFQPENCYNEFRVYKLGGDFNGWQGVTI